MSEPSLELQGAILTALKADAGVDALIADRIYDKVPPAPTFPYVTISDDQVVSAHADCLDNSTQVFSTLHAWSRAGPGRWARPSPPTSGGSPGATHSARVRHRPRS